MEVQCDSTSATKELANRVASELSPGAVLALYGDLGSGKTTFVKYLVEALNIQTRVQSPTFIINRTYVGNGKNGISVVFHLDLYRLSSVEEVADLGLEEIFSYSNALVAIEWPEVAESYLPKHTMRIKFTDAGGDLRCIKFI